MIRPSIQARRIDYKGRTMIRAVEVTRLKARDIDHERMQVFAYLSKEKKYRYATLSPILQDVLVKYVSI